MSPYLLVVLSFVVLILLGSFLLTLPVAQKNGSWGTYIDCFFVATSATCVTGLCPLPNGIGATFTLFGQVVVLLCIQIGGLGFITILSFIITLFKRRILFKSRYFISQAVGSNGIGDLAKFLRKIILISLSYEIAGFLLLLPAFFSMKSLSVSEVFWNSFFTSVSAFNNAGFDLLGNTSLVRASNPYLLSMPDGLYYYMCSVIMILIICGGLSFLTHIDILSFKRPKQWSALTKIILFTTAILIILGTCVFLLTDGLKGEGSIDFFNALFQSVTCRTAGFASYDQSKLSSFGLIASSFLMFIGGSPLSTAGGVKTTTLFLIVLAIAKYLRGKKVTAFKREYTTNSIIKAMALVFISFALVIISFGILCILEKNNDAATSDNLYFEVFSAFGTVGLSASLTPTLSLGSKLVLCLLMFFGRLGPMSILQVFENSMGKKSDDHFEYVQEDIVIG